jgi:glycopeptide antibiotics resistance protein
MIIAATAIPVALRPLQQAELQFLFSVDASEMVANTAGFVPVGIVLATLGPVRAVMAAALLSMFVETSQLVMLYRVEFGASLRHCVTVNESYN